MAKNEIFISYRHDDSGRACDLIYQRLRYTFGRNKVFRDLYDMPASPNIRAESLQKARNCKVLLAIVGSQWLTLRGASGAPRLWEPGDLVHEEILTALPFGKVIPVLVDGAHMPQPNQLPNDLFGLVPPDLTGPTWMQIRSGVDADNDLNALCDAISQRGVRPDNAICEPGPAIAQWGALCATPTAICAIIFASTFILSAPDTYDYNGLALTSAFISCALFPLIAGLIVGRCTADIASGVRAGITANALGGALAVAVAIVELIGHALDPVLAVGVVVVGVILAAVAMGIGLFTGWIGGLLGALIRADSRRR